MRPEPTSRQQLLDEQFLDALGRGGEPPEGGGRLVAGLATWREDISAGIPPARFDPATVLPPTPVVARHRIRWRRLIAGAGAALAVAGGGGAATVAAAGDAGPGSPLWPITRVVHPELAEARVAEQAVADAVAAARVAAEDGRYGDAVRRLAEAEQLVPRVPERSARERLLAEVAQVRALISADLPAGEVPPAGDVPLPDPDPGAGPAPVPELPPGDPAPDPALPPLPGEPTPDPAPEPEPEPTGDPGEVLPSPPLPSLPPLDP